MSIASIYAVKRAQVSVELLPDKLLSMGGSLHGIGTSVRIFYRLE
ncbi:hypothetical protein [Rhizobium paranaense]|uniref:Uncharacterized protein n=1 Tax=Rhizobium paranaense TaxID=1650438 RepID=A0A7W8XXC3_9HYPH|nr:hypothetical protein [Rhizobium paranaense]MBB5577095.1 hypothetical protein [Rhizobium paranaense]